MPRTTGLLIQARTGSSRLPGKMTLPFWDGRNILELLLERLLGSGINLPVIVATTQSKGDDIIADISRESGASVFRGSETDVLDRFINAAQHFQIDNVLRICADNPFLDLELLKCVIARINASSADYVSYAMKDGTPSIKTHFGFFTEGTRLEALTRAAQATAEALYHEHVTNYIYGNPSQFALEFLDVPEIIQKNTSIRLTVDTKADFETAKAIYAIARQDGDLGYEHIIELVTRHQEKYLPAMKAQIQNNGK